MVGGGHCPPLSKSPPILKWHSFLPSQKVDQIKLLNPLNQKHKIYVEITKPAHQRTNSYENFIWTLRFWELTDHLIGVIWEGWKRSIEIRKKISFQLFFRKDKLVFSQLRGKSERFRWDLSVFSLDSPKMNLPI